MSATIGQQLKNARLDRNLSLEDVFKDTHIRIKYLEALEADDFSLMPSPVQGRGFLRLYAQYLDLNSAELLEELQAQSEEEQTEFQKIASPQEKNIKEETDIPAPATPEAVESPWERFQQRLSASLASSKPESANEEDPAPITEASHTDTRVPLSPVEEEIPLVPPEASQMIFAEIGTTLRERREMLSLTYEEIEGHLHLRPRYLAALEAGDFDALLSPVQTRGMLSNYADFLDLDADALLIRFAEGLQARRTERHQQDGIVLDGKPKKRKAFSFGGFIAPDLIFGIGMAALLIAFSIWGLGRIAQKRIETEVEATAPSIAEVLMMTPTLGAENTVTPTVMVNTPAPNIIGGTELPADETSPDPEFTGVRLLVTILERTWMRVSVDGEIVFDGRAKPNASFVYEGNESVEILVGNGAGVRVAYNQKDMGLLGGFGEVVQRLYGARAILTPTITPTLPATFTPTPTVTPSPTASFTPTPIPTK
jgi:cytoskeletal protein RodZ